ncbi:MAG: DUF2163 domain-containing protein [Hyphomicrobium sp.]|uniref:DUF2163 domain-containing protein n=1 Tax=Hyphomicrobium sp. TaxID=82 RepID=UPI0039E290DF
MKSLSPEFAAHLASGATTLCWCWRIARRDGTVLGFTDHDNALTFDSTTYEAASGFTASDISDGLGLSVDNLEVTGALSSATLTDDDLAAGRYDDARIEIYRVNWADPSQRVLMRAGSIGEVRRTGSSFTAELRGLAHYLQQPTGRLSGLLRGQFGTEGAMATLATGAQFVLLDGAVTRVPLDESERRLTLNWRYGPGNRDIGDASYITTPFAYQGLGLRPLSPVHVKGSRASGDLTLTWIRRTRSGGDNWELPEVPLGEESESYEVDILDGTTVKRTLTTTTPSVVYSSADQIADFGSVQSSVSVKVYQTNVLFGRSTPRAAVV